jgi:phosphate-selective porin OprO/OprP
MLSGAYHFNHGALRTQGQLGNELFEPRDLTSILIDAILKYNGWALQTAYMSRDTKEPITINPDNNLERRFVIAGSGYDAQLSYIFPSNLEFMGRYSLSMPNNEIAAFLPESQQFSIGATKYIWEHAFKLQTEVTYEQLSLNNVPTKNNWYVRFQIEMGI